MQTPKQKRYSCISNISNYGTPRDNDDSENSMYYSFVSGEEDSKENSANGGQWTVTDSSSPIIPNVASSKTPLLRKVLQTNYTPRNKNNKRVSFSQIPKPCPTPEVASKMSKTSESCVDMIADTTFELKVIEESLPDISNENDVKDPVQQIPIFENGVESVTVNESPFNISDGLEGDLHDTVIENSSPIPANITLTDNMEMPANPSVVQGAEISSKAPDMTASNETRNRPVEVQERKSTVPPTVKNSAPLPKKVQTNVKTVEEILQAGQKTAQSKNTIKIGRQQLASDSRKSILPVVKKLTTRATTYKRRSSTYEPRKVDPRKSLAVLKNVASQVSKTLPTEKNKASELKRPTAPVTKTSTSNVPVSSKNSVVKTTATKIDAPAPRTIVNKSRLTIAQPTVNPVARPTKPPKMSIVSTRQSMSSNVRAQRRETRSFLTTFAMAKASTSSVAPSTSSTQHTFVKPSALPVRKSLHPSMVSSATVTSNGKTNTNQSGKCQYCDKFFVKSHGLKTHQLEKCEKIPSSARRQLLQKENESNEANSKQTFTRRSQAFPQIDEFSKYSRFFVNLSSNGGASGTQNDVNAAEINWGLKNLRAEIRKRAPSGIQRTPQKPIRCHLCKKLFFDCVEYADHSANHPAIN
ncbi:uncharacterized protein LOC116338272 isoform X2 [Contarinia nasturtii]|uniref:uncharacterized protein LOC116338272 isoform X2 n=1 Tax=Contarinia nasturtii TaxID=265458 RepID=UPI0012D4516B|nr:uncharacterized protein LOC116338272 isoform X2 [Contarinia nasturtii]